MASARSVWSRQQAAEHRELADAERYLARILRGIGEVDQAERHVINAALHELRAGAFEAAAHGRRKTPETGLAGCQPPAAPARRR
jgi:hypothetical protein